jgi:hypothetical protein
MTRLIENVGGPKSNLRFVYPPRDAKGCDWSFVVVAFDGTRYIADEHVGQKSRRLFDGKESK